MDMSTENLARWLSLQVGLITALLLLCAAPALPQALPPAAVVRGTIVDDTGAPVVEATVALFSDESSRSTQAASGADGQFSLSTPPGPFRLIVSAPGFAEQIVSGVAVAGEVSTWPRIQLTVVAEAVSVDVTPTLVEVAERQLKEQEQQRVFGIVPNFLVSYNPDAAPLNSRQKLELSWKAHIDPVQFGVVALVAGVQQARGSFSAFGGGPQGYAKRYAAAYATVLTRSLITQAALPSVFHQDPRYFYKGTGSARSRIAYALSRAVVRKGDDGTVQPNYSGILGSLAGGAISNFYYPPPDRHGVQLTLENAAIGMGVAAVAHLAQEFLFRPPARSTRHP